MRKFNFSLSLKLIVYLIGSMLIVFALLGYQSLKIHKRNLEDMTNVMADQISTTIKDSTHYSMLQNHRDEVYHIISTIGKKPGIKKIRILNKEGKISYSTDIKEMNTFVDKKAESCYVCHSQEQPLEHLNRPDRMRTYFGPNEERIMGLINPIENELSCSSGGCHAHPKEKKLLGVLDVTLSLASVDKAAAQAQRRMIGWFVGATFIVSILFASLVWIVIYRPIHQLIRGTKHLASGDLDHKIKISSRDEIGELATSFNDMTAKLREAHGELEDWGHSLEKRVEEKTAELKRANEHMVQIERMASIGKLASIVAHEINNPLAGILTYSKVLLKRISSGQVMDPEKMKQELEMIAGESARCGEIVKNLLQFSRQTAPNLKLHNLNELVQQSIRLVQHKMDLMNIQTKTNLEEPAPILVCDEQQIKQALVALLINACEAVQPAEGIVEVKTRSNQEKNTVQITIKDNGIGMDQETQKHVFEPFFTTKETTTGLGLGLSVVYGIVTKHSGNIEIESAPGKGAMFLVELPVKPESNDEERM
ncbi:MAG TPA: ATP-binding protein [Acidobacteriota bacterium]|nr:ATP-binding protein [Acidobacteriota bacterium]